MGDKSGVQLITKERWRQITEEGWTAEHDKQHTDYELAKVAVCYASPWLVYERMESGDGVWFNDPWPNGWDKQYDKRKRQNKQLVPNRILPKSERIRNLVKAGALIAAQIDIELGQ